MAMQSKHTYTQDSAQSPLISFIVTDYNLSLEMLMECLDSIFALSLSDNEREVILVDDGSKESPVSGLLKYIDNIVYVRQRNQGVSVARNVGMEIAKGKYIQFVDGDDCLLSAPYEHCLDIIRYKDADMVMFRFTKKQKSQQSGNDYLKFDGPVSGHEYMRHNNLRASPWGYIFKRTLLGTLHFHRGIEYGEDEEFTPQLMLRAEKLYTTDSPAYYYRQWGNSAIHQNDTRRKMKRLHDSIDVICTLRDRADVLPYNDRTALQRRVDQLTMDYLYNIIVMTRSSHYLERSIKRLHEKGLFPLPDKDYTKKYKYFRRLVNSKIGRRILIATLPKIS